MQQVYFKPWVGSNYTSGGILSKRTLILGESYYQKDDGTALGQESTREMVTAQIEGTWSMRFFTSVVRAILDLDHPPTLDEKSDFWNSVIHYVYVQSPVGSRPRERPSASMWAEAHDPFLTILSEYQPEFIVVLGNQLWNNLPIGEPGPGISGAKQKATRKYPVGNGKLALAYGVQHPSSIGFSAKRWHPFIREAMELA
jgi:hypothetical protein